MPSVLPRILSWRRLLPVDWWRPGVAGVTPVPLSVDLVEARLLLVKQTLEEFRHLCRLGPPAAESPAGCWCSRPLGRSRPFWPNVVEIPGTSAGRWLCPWPTRIVIPTTTGYHTTYPKVRTQGAVRVRYRLQRSTATEDCRGFSCRKNTGYHTTDPKIRKQGAVRVRSRS
jgi:hypothetical protein